MFRKTLGSDQASAQDNVRSFIASCKSECLRGAILWATLKWPAVAFTKLGSPRRGRAAPPLEQLFSEEFLDFSKSYLWHLKLNNPKAAAHQYYGGLRLIERALVNITGSAYIWELSVHILDEVAVVARGCYGAKETAYTFMCYVERIVSFLSEKNMIRGDLRGWISPIKKPNSARNKIGQKGDEYRQSKLPSQDALDAIAEIFSAKPELPRDILTSSFVAIAMCAPSRAIEILQLPVNAEVIQLDTAGTERYGWRFFSAKGYEGDIKWIPSSMVPIAKIAFERIRELTEPGRKLARWIEEFPDQFFRHSGCPDVLEDQPLTIIQAAQALGLNVTKRERAYNALTYRELSTEEGGNTLRKLWQHVLGRLPKGFPWLCKEKNMRFSNALFCVLRNQAHASRPTLYTELHKILPSFFSFDLTPRENVKGHKSIFDRHGYRSADNQAFKINTHEPRHFLNTVANRVGMSQEYIAKWSGRTNSRQNRVYNHVPDSEVFSTIRESILVSSAPSSLALEARSINPIKDDEFLGIINPAAHVTEAGYCTHNWLITPCMKYRDCINCEEQVCVKGESEKLERLRLRLLRTEALLAAALAESDEEAIGVDRWIAHHKMTVERIRQMIMLLTDESIPDGALLRLSGQSFTRVGRALALKNDVTVVGNHG